MGNIGAGELIFIAMFALLIFGPKRLPEIGRSVGRALAEVRKATNELKEGFTSGFEDFNFNEIRELRDLTNFRDLKEPLVLNGPIKATGATHVTNQTAPTPPPNHPNELSTTVQASPTDPTDPTNPVIPAPQLLGTGTADADSGPSAGSPQAPSSPDSPSAMAASPDGPSAVTTGEDGAPQR